MTTQMTDADTQDTGDTGQIGRRVGGDLHELFVSCDPAEALQQQFDKVRGDFLVLHELGAASATRRLLGGVATASRQAMQRLIIRRQGYGTELATLDFLDLPAPDGKALRLYLTPANGDPALRERLVHVLLAHSRLGVLMVGELPTPALQGALETLRRAMVPGAWPNRHLLLLPLGSSSATLAQESVALGRGSGVQVRTTPQVARPSEAWSFISGTWNKLRGEWQTAAAPAPAFHVTSAPVPLEAPSSAAYPPAPHPAWPTGTPLTPMPALRQAGAAAGTPVESTLGRYVRLLCELPGVVSCCVFDVANARALAHAGSRPGPESLASHGSAMIAALTSSSRSLGLGHVLPEAAVTLGSHHLVIRPVPKHPGVALHAVLDKVNANLTLARLQIARLDATFDEPTS